MLLDSLNGIVKHNLVGINIGWFVFGNMVSLIIEISLACSAGCRHGHGCLVDVDAVFSHDLMDIIINLRFFDIGGHSGKM